MLLTHTFLRKEKHSLNPGANASKFSSWDCVPKSMLIKINIDISSEFIFETKTISAKTNETHTGQTISLEWVNFAPTAKNRTQGLEKLRTKASKEWGSANSVQCLLDQRGGGVNTRLKHNQKPHKWVHK